MPNTWLSLETLALVTTAGVFGAILFFSVVVTPVAFIKLPAEQAGAYIRAVFPWYYLWLIVFAAVAAFAFVWRHPIKAALAALIVALSAVARLGLMPRLNRLRDPAKAGDPEAGHGFRRLHRISVALNLVSLAASTAALTRFIAGLS